MTNEETRRAKAPAKGRKRPGRDAKQPAGELWARCPECHMPVKDAVLFKHLLNCPGAEVKRAEWAAEQASAAQPTSPTAPPPSNP